MEKKTRINKLNWMIGIKKEKENIRKAELKLNKPYVWEKMQRYPEKLARGESIAIIQFQYDFICNFKCEHCSISKFQVSKKEDETKRKFSLDDVKSLAKQANEMGLAQFVITGGEPLIFKDYDELVEAIDPSKFYIVSDSNGWNLDYERAKHLKEIGIDKIQLSMDGANAKSHDKFRNKPGSWKRCVKAIAACKKAGLHLILSTVVWKDRVKSKEFIRFLEFAKKKEVGTYISFAKPVGAYEGRFDQLLDEEDAKYIEYLETKYDIFTHMTPSYGMDVGCIAVKRMVPITRYGDVLPCPYTHVSLGNVLHESLQNIIQRGLNIKWFDPTKKMPCLCGVDRKFIKDVIEPTYGKPLPVSYKEIFTDKDYIK